MRLRSSWITPANSRHSRHSVLAKGQSPPPGRAARLISGQPKEARAELLAAHATVGQLDRRPPIIERFRSMTISVVSVGKNKSEIIDKLKSLLFSLLAGNLVRWKTDRKAITRWGWSRIVASCAASICGGRHPGLGGRHDDARARADVAELTGRFISSPFDAGDFCLELASRGKTRRGFMLSQQCPWFAAFPKRRNALWPK